MSVTLAPGHPSTQQPAAAPAPAATKAPKKEKVK